MFEQAFKNIDDVLWKDACYIIDNPSFGGEERKEVRQNFPIRTAGPIVSLN